MKISVILGHPYSKSFNAAIAEAVVAQLEKNGHDVRFHDLCAEGFNPAMTAGELKTDAPEDRLTEIHQRELREADGIVIVHPNWWGMPPAVVTGWIDRVIRENVAYAFPTGDSGGGVPDGLLKAKAALVFNTSNTPEARENTVFGDPLQRIWKDCVFDFCGVRTFDRLIFRVVADSSPEQRGRWLDQARALTARYFPKE